MAYGILIENDGGRVQIDSESTGVGFIVTDSGTSSTLALSTSNEVTFARPNVRTSTMTIAYQALGFGSFNPGFYDRNGNAIVCNWIRGRWANDSNNTPSSTGYGIQIYNSDNELAFDSGLYDGDGGFGVTNYVPSGDITVPANNDANDGVNNNTVISTDINAYYDMTNTTRVTGFSTSYAGYVFRPATGVHWVSYSTVSLGFPPVANTVYGPNPTVFYGEVGSV